MDTLAQCEVLRIPRGNPKDRAWWFATNLEVWKYLHDETSVCKNAIHYFEGNDLRYPLI